MSGISLLKKILVIVGIILLANTIFMLVVSNFNLGLLALGVFSISIVIYGLLWHKIKIAKWIHIVFITTCFILISFSGFLAFYGNNDTAQYNEDVVIILGAGIHGERVSRTLAHRLDEAVKYYAENPNAVFVVSGGQGMQETITEALAMERYLTEKGIPVEKIIKEEKSTSTYENFSFSDSLIKQKFPSGYSAVFITNSFHIFRANKIAQYVGVSANHIGATIDWYAVPVNYMREMMAVVKFWVFG